MTKRVKYEMLCERRAELLEEMHTALQNKDKEKFKEILTDFCVVAGELERLLEEIW